MRVGILLRVPFPVPWSSGPRSRGGRGTSCPAQPRSDEASPASCPRSGSELPPEILRFGKIIIKKIFSKLISKFKKVFQPFWVTEPFLDMANLSSPHITSLTRYLSKSICWQPTSREVINYPSCCSSLDDHKLHWGLGIRTSPVIETPSL